MEFRIIINFKFRKLWMHKKIKNVTYAHNDNDLLTPYVGS